jgi:hypothetical protein
MIDKISELGEVRGYSRLKSKLVRIGGELVFQKLSENDWNILKNQVVIIDKNFPETADEETLNEYLVNL